MKRGITVLLSLSVLVTGAYFTAKQVGDPSRDNHVL